LTTPASPEAAPPSITPPIEFPVVGLGASAGGLAAFTAFFSGMPTQSDPGMAFVLVQHLAPDHDSLLTELIQRSTRMKVLEVQDGMRVEVNCVYIIPPKRDLAFLNGALHLLEPSAARGQRLPIDFLFRSLAQDLHERAIGIVLSGTGADGTLGVRAIKEVGGMVMAQSMASCEFDAMPHSAIATGVVDYELPPQQMPAQLMVYTKHLFGKPPRKAAELALPQSENTLKKIFILLRAQTGHDFSQYKPNTIYRRIERRMAVHQVESLESYVQYLQQTPVEVDALFRDLLIGVTHFFRDPEAFAALEALVISQLFEGKPPGSVVRAWTSGCSTGEEAYSIAILLQEQLEATKQNFHIQVFATDIDSRAIAVARAGVYPASIAQNISPERLARYFTLEPSGNSYRVHKSIRDLLVFSEQDLIKDPPFSKLDLITCRNLMIYLGADLQKKLISLFHYALRPGGMLFLGSSETVGDSGDLFGPIDRKAKIYQRKEDLQGTQRASLGRFLTPTARVDSHPTLLAGNTAQPSKPSLRELTEQTLLQQVDKAAALVNAQGDVLYLHGRTGMYLEPAPGEAGISNIVKMARDGLRRDLTTTLHKTVRAKEAHSAKGLRVKTNGHYTLVNLTVCPVVQGPVAALDSPLFLVILEQTAPSNTAMASASHADTKPSTEIHDNSAALAQIAELKGELQAKEEYLHAANEALETANEELKSSNEELQSSNEELQSSNEELETSKEELQSINEELSTVNTELQSKVNDLSRANNDMNNLLAGTGIGTIFVDQRMRILRFTPAATLMINLIPSDVGRPVAHIVSNLVDYNHLVADAQAVLDTLIPKEIDVQTTEGKWFTLRILPYRTLDNVIEGVVMTFIDISEMVNTREALRQANERMHPSSKGTA
jgi:two-component system CheB/CheR fusion protein